MTDPRPSLPPTQPSGPTHPGPSGPGRTMTLTYPTPDPPPQPPTPPKPSVCRFCAAAVENDQGAWRDTGSGEVFCDYRAIAPGAGPRVHKPLRLGDQPKPNLPPGAPHPDSPPAGTPGKWPYARDVGAGLVVGSAIAVPVLILLGGRL